MSGETLVTHVRRVLTCAAPTKWEEGFLSAAHLFLFIYRNQRSDVREEKRARTPDHKLIRTAIECNVKCLHVSYGMRMRMCKLSQKLDYEKLQRVSFQVALNAVFSFCSFCLRWSRLFLLPYPNITAWSYNELSPMLPRPGANELAFKRNRCNSLDVFPGCPFQINS